MLDYTLAQVAGYLDAIGKAEKARLRGEILAVRSVWMEGNAFEELWRKLD